VRPHPNCRPSLDFRIAGIYRGLGRYAGPIENAAASEQCPIPNETDCHGDIAGQFTEQPPLL